MIRGGKCIRGATIILPGEVVTGDVIIEAGRIKAINYGDVNEGIIDERYEIIEAEGMYLMPGLIDIHSDAIEKEIQPRPNAMFPLDMSFRELEKKLAGCGITTMYHSLSLCEDWGVRNRGIVVDIIEKIVKYRSKRAMIDHKIHLRYEITFLEGLEMVEELLDKAMIDLLSIMDHTPGQGQFNKDGTYQEYMTKSYGLSGNEAEAAVNKLLEMKKQINFDKLTSIANKAYNKGISLASHDDDCADKIDELISYKGTVSEFPINVETARYAKKKGIWVCVGAPNVVRGGSHSKNMRAMDAIQDGSVDIICSDYLPSSMIPAVLKISDEGLELYDAVRMITINPAKALGIDRDVGSIEVGKKANIVLVEMHEGYPLVRKTFVEGKLIYQNNFHIYEQEGVRGCL